MGEFYVYVWRRPCGAPFYVGKGQGSRSHIERGRSPHFARIVAKIRAAGDEPSVSFAGIGLSESEAFDLEAALISEYGRANLGGLLCNLTDGGEGTSGWIPTEETRMRIRIANTGKPLAEERRAKISKSRTGHAMSEIAKLKIAASKIGVRRSDETRAKIGAAKTGITKTDETRQRMAAAQRHRGPSRDMYKGVTPSGKKWKASIRANGRTRYVGTGETPEEAAMLYDAAAYAQWGTDCYLNFGAEYLAAHTKSIAAAPEFQFANEP